MPDNLLARRILVGLVLACITIFALTRIYTYLTTGGLSVSSPTKNSIVKITKIDADGSDSKPAFSRQEPQKLSLRLKPGQYKVSSSTQSFLTTKIVKVNTRHSLSVTLKLPPTSLPEPVYGGDVDAMAIDASQMLFIDMTNTYLSRIDAQNQLSAVDSARTLASADWANTGLGVAMGTDGSFYSIQAGMLSPIALPFKPNANPSISYSISQDGTVYISNGETVYAGDINGNFKKIYSSGNNYNVDVAAGKDRVAIIEKSSGGNSSSVVIVSKTGQLIAKKNINSSQVVWSPDGKRLAAVGSGSSSSIYDDSLNRVALIPSNGLNNLVWQNNSNVIYDANNTLWSYGLQSQQSVAIANITPGTSLSEMTVDADSAYVYFVSTANDKDEVDRVGLQGQKALSVVYQLDVFFPKAVGSDQPCFINYINFGSPSIQALMPLGTTEQVCEQELETELNQDALSAGALKINYGPIVISNSNPFN
jgi:hypothetical protein